MNVYKADAELVTILLNQGFIETTPAIEKTKGKRFFETKINSRKKEVYFDYNNIKFIISPSNIESCSQLTEHELKLLLLFFRLNSNQRKEISDTGHFTFNKAAEYFSSISEELKILREIDFRASRQKKLSQIIETYNSIQL